MTAASDPSRPAATSDDDRGDRGGPPARPVAIELGAAVLIAGGAFRLLAVGVAIAAPGNEPLAPAVAGAETLLQTLTIVTGLLLRTGRAWLAVVNIVAVLAFLELLNLRSPVSLAYALLYGMAFVAAFRNRPWFDARARFRSAHPPVRA